MGCSHSARRPENVRTRSKKLMDEIKRYSKFDYNENPENAKPPKLQQAGQAIPEFYVDSINIEV